MSAYLKHQSLHSRTRIPIFMLRGMPGLPASTVLAPLRKDRHSQNGTDKSHDFQLLPVPFWLCLSFLSGANTVEAGYPGIPRSINMGICVRLCSDWCLREADILSDYPQTSVSCIVRTQYPYFAQRYAGITGFGPLLVLTLNFYSTYAISFSPFSSVSMTMVWPSLILPSRMILAARVSTFFWRYLLSGRAP